MALAPLQIQLVSEEFLPGPILKFNSFFRLIVYEKFSFMWSLNETYLNVNIFSVF